jgi:dephospho-CoA kinase
VPAPRVLLVALTGGIATGKSHCLNRFAQLGAGTISADQLARDAVAPGTPGLDAVVERFGRSVLHDDGTLNRGALGNIVFNDADARRHLETIVHPLVYDAIQEWAAADHPAGTILIADIPLLYETGHDRGFDKVIVVACRPDQQLARLIARDGLTPAEAQQRIDTQMPIQEKVRRANYVIDTSGTFEDTDRGVQSVWNALRSIVAP